MNIEDIKKIVREKKLTYKELSIRSNIPEGTLKNIFSLRVASPRLDTINAICFALGITNDITTQPTIVQYGKEYRNAIVVYDSAGTAHEFAFKADNADKMLRICKDLTNL